MKFIEYFEFKVTYFFAYMLTVIMMLPAWLAFFDLWFYVVRGSTLFVENWGDGRIAGALILLFVSVFMGTASSILKSDYNYKLRVQERNNRLEPKIP